MGVCGVFVCNIQSVDLRTKDVHVVLELETWHVDKAPAKTRNARLDAFRSAVPKIIACLYSLRCELVNIA